MGVCTALPCTAWHDIRQKETPRANAARPGLVIACMSALPVACMTALPVACMTALPVADGPAATSFLAQTGGHFPPCAALPVQIRAVTQHSARICRMKCSAAERKRRVDAVLAELGLTGAANTPVGTLLIKGISSGQKRRLAIACEAVVEPMLLFLDEPTSGVFCQ